MSLKKQYVEIDALKGWAIFLVVLGHAIILHPINLHDDPFWQTIVNIATSVHMPLFFFVSGYCYSFRGNYREYIQKKVKRLLVPYYIFCLFNSIPKALLGNLLHYPKDFDESIINILFYGGYYWFLWTLFLIFAFFPLIQKLCCRNQIAVFSTTLVFAVLSVIEVPTTLLCLNSVARFLVWFWLGVQFRNIWDFEKRLTTKPVSSILFVLSAVIWISLCCMSLARTPVEINIKHAVEAAVGIICCLAATRFSIFNQMFARFGKYSLQLYLLNAVLLGLSRTLICTVLHVESGVIIVLFNMLVDFFLSYLLIKYVCTKIRPVRFAMGMN